MRFFCLIVIFILSVSLKAQDVEKERDFLLSNYISDIGVCSFCSKESFLHGADIIFQYGIIDSSPKYALKRKSMEHEERFVDSIEYYVQFYKIQGNDRVDNLYVVHLVDKVTRHIDVWLRVAGWRENDMRFLYLTYKKNGLRERDFKHMVLSWYSVDSIAREAQLDKILEGAIKNEMNDDCFISEHYKLLDSLRHRDMGPTDSKELYSTFSRQPMDGMWVEY